MGKAVDQLRKQENTTVLVVVTSKLLFEEKKSHVLGNLRIFLCYIVIFGDTQHLTSVRRRFQSVRCPSYGGVRHLESLVIEK